MTFHAFPPSPRFFAPLPPPVDRSPRARVTFRKALQATFTVCSVRGRCLTSSRKRGESEFLSGSGPVATGREPTREGGLSCPPQRYRSTPSRGTTSRSSVSPDRACDQPRLAPQRGDRRRLRLLLAGPVSGYDADRRSRAAVVPARGRRRGHRALARALSSSAAARTRSRSPMCPSRSRWCSAGASRVSAGSRRAAPSRSRFAGCRRSSSSSTSRSSSSRRRSATSSCT